MGLGAEVGLGRRCFFSLLNSKEAGDPWTSEAEDGMDRDIRTLTLLPLALSRST
jgi:hypothetical protein